MTSITETLREKYRPYSGLETPDMIMKLCDEYDRMRAFIVRLQKTLEAPSVPEKPL